MDSRKVAVKRTKRFGKGVFAIKKICKGERIASFDGSYYDHRDEWTDDMYYHSIQYGQNKWRDSRGLARFINHSCDPNCGIKRRFDVVAMRDIAAGEQITWDYEMTEKNLHFKMRCRCGSELCRREIGDYRRMPAKIRRKYGTFISLWLRRKRS